MIIRIILYFLIIQSISCCSGGSGDSSYTVGGNVSGLSASGLVIHVDTNSPYNSNEYVEINSDGEFSTSTVSKIKDGSNYVITIVDTPSSQYCTIQNSIGIIHHGDVTTIEITCRNVIGMHTNSELQRVEALAINNGYGYFAAGSNGLLIYDVSNPSSILKISSIDNATWSNINSVSIDPVKKLAYLSDDSKGMHVVNIADKLSPNYIDYVSNEDWTMDLGLVPGYFACIGNGYGVKFINVNNTLETYNLNLSGDVLGIKTMIPTINTMPATYVASADGLHIINTAQPFAPVEVAHFGEGMIIWSVDVKDSYAYVTFKINYLNGASDKGLLVVDISNPYSPVEVGRYYVPSWDYFVDTKVVVKGQYAYITSANVGVYIIDISEPTQMIQRGFYSGIDGDKELTINGGFVYIANNGYGIEILEEP